MDFGRGALLWLLGVPLPIILLLAARRTVADHPAAGSVLASLICARAFSVPIESERRL